ncbi:MAG: nicotinate-nucleotide--dimethylbenzimidazole phosphoribosyltransferase [Bacteroides sp.]|nr:nicotinate-nucleotide--dimethylbenzimidazole phosphoribosyltransferase [Bacteroides sp.]
MQFDIKPIADKALASAITDKINNLTKPKGSLGRLESLALQIGLIQRSLSPRLHRPVNVLFAADHGIIAEGVSVSPKEVTWQQLGHFARGGAGINFLCKQHGFILTLVDAGVDFDIPGGCGIIDMKMGRGTDNFLYGAAMSFEQWEECLRRGAEIVDREADAGTNIISFGEMGSGNTSASSMWMHITTGIPLDNCIGAGAGLSSDGINHKRDVLNRALAGYSGDGTVIDRLRWFGGFEMAMATGAMLRAAERRMIVIVDGFIMTACIAAAIAINPAVKDYAIFGHCGDESGHRKIIDALGADPLLHLSLRLGEGSGAVCAYPIIDSAVRMINEMDSFADTDVTKYF